MSKLPSIAAQECPREAVSLPSRKQDHHQSCLSTDQVAAPPMANKDGAAGAEQKTAFVSVAIRVKPAAPSRPGGETPRVALWAASDDRGRRQRVCCNRGYLLEEYEFSRVVGPEDDNRKLFGYLQGPALAASVFSGVNETLFAYGATGSGKTHTIFGTHGEQGLLGYFVGCIFDKVRHGAPGSTVHVCCYEVVGDTLTDLVDPTCFIESGDLQADAIVFDELFVKTQRSRYRIVKVGDRELCMELLEDARSKRTSGVSSTNAASSRSHAVVHIFVQNPGPRSVGGLGSTSIGAMTLVDLAGAEREHENPSAHGRRTTRLLNTSLSSLNRLLRKLQTGSLGESERRQSVLNKCLWEYLRPGCGIALIFCVSPLLEHQAMALSTLSMATDSKLIHSRRKSQYIHLPEPPPPAFPRPRQPPHSSGPQRHALRQGPTPPATPPLRSRCHSAAVLLPVPAAPSSPAPRRAGAAAPCLGSSLRRKAEEFTEADENYDEVDEDSEESQEDEEEEEEEEEETVRCGSRGRPASRGQASYGSRYPHRVGQRAASWAAAGGQGSRAAGAGCAQAEVVATVHCVPLHGERKLRRRHSRTRARSQERIGKVERERDQLTIEKEALARECESLRTLFIRQQRQQIAFWTGPFMEMVGQGALPMRGLGVFGRSGPPSDSFGVGEASRSSPDLSPAGSSAASWDSRAAAGAEVAAREEPFGERRAALRAAAAAAAELVAAAAPAAKMTSAELAFEHGLWPGRSLRGGGGDAGSERSTASSSGGTARASWGGRSSTASSASGGVRGAGPPSSDGASLGRARVRAAQAPAAQPPAADTDAEGGGSGVSEAGASTAASDPDP